MEIASAQLLKLIVHRVGNRSREEGLSLSIDAIDAGPDVDAILVEHYLFGTFESGARYAFDHESDLALNEVRSFANQALSDGPDFEEASRAIARHLYGKSTHPSVSGGDLFVSLFELTDGPYRGSRVLGIFKTEIMERFLIVDESAGGLTLTRLSGIDPRQLQKAALIFGHDGSVAAVERGSAKTRYWLEDFLKVRPVATARGITSFVTSLAKRAGGELADPSAQTAFKSSIAKRLAPGEAPSVGELLELTAEFVGRDATDAIARDIESGLGFELGHDAVADVRQLKRSLNAMLRSIPVSKGIDLVFSKGVTATSVDVGTGGDKNTIHIVIKLQGQ